jgi:hypothetical protein
MPRRFLRAIGNEFSSRLGQKDAECLNLFKADCSQREGTQPYIPAIHRRRKHLPDYGA